MVPDRKHSRRKELPKQDPTGQQGLVRLDTYVSNLLRNRTQSEVEGEKIWVHPAKPTRNKFPARILDVQTGKRQTITGVSVVDINTLSEKNPTMLHLAPGTGVKRFIGPSPSVRS